MPRHRSTREREPLRKPRARRRPFFRNFSYMEAYEERIILADVLAMTRGGNDEVSVTRLRLFAPMRYGPKLTKVLKRMHERGDLHLYGRSRRNRTNLYRLREQARLRYDQEAA